MGPEGPCPGCAGCALEDGTPEDSKAVLELKRWAAVWLWIFPAAAGGCFWAAGLALECILLLECAWEDRALALLCLCLPGVAVEVGRGAALLTPEAVLLLLVCC